MSNCVGNQILFFMKTIGQPKHPISIYIFYTSSKYSAQNGPRIRFPRVQLCTKNTRMKTNGQHTIRHFPQRMSNKYQNIDQACICSHVVGSIRCEHHAKSVAFPFAASRLSNRFLFGQKNFRLFGVKQI